MNPEQVIRRPIVLTEKANMLRDKRNQVIFEVARTAADSADGREGRAAFLAKRKAAFVLNQCPPNYRSARASEAAKGLTSLGVLAEPLLSARMDYQDALARGFGVTEFSRDGRAAREVQELWRWSCEQIGEFEPPAANQNKSRMVVAAA